MNGAGPVQSLGGDRADLTTSPPPTPIHSRFHTSEQAPLLNPAQLVAILPPRASPSVASRGPDFSVVSDTCTAMNTTIAPSQEPSAVPYSGSEVAPVLQLPPPPPVPPPRVASEQLGDGDSPLFRAVIGSLVKRASTLRSALKAILKSSEASLASLQQYMATQNTIDKSLQALSLSSATSKSDVLGGFFELVLSERRAASRIARELEVRQMEELLERVRGSCERLKTLEAKHRAFEAAAKKYYEDLAKYLARSEADETKAAALDAKQASRSASFQSARLEFFSFIESLVDSEERAVAAWLNEWVESEAPVNVSALSRPLKSNAGRANTQGNRLSMITGLNLDMADIPVPPPAAFGVEDELERDTSDSGHLSDDGVSAYASGGSGFSQPREGVSGGTPAVTRRASIGFPSEGARGRIKDFMKSLSGSPPTILSGSRPVTPDASTSGPSHIKSSNRHSMLPTLSQIGTAPTPPRQRQSSASEDSMSIPVSPPDPLFPSLMARSQPASLRKREGFLWATSSMTTSGDSNGQWHKFWTVLAEGQLIEFTNWKTSLTVRGTPINLRYASTRVCRPSEMDRRFCFLVITPTTRRVYQAISQTDATEWVAAISRSIEALLNGTSSVRHFDASRLSGTLGPYVLNDFGGSSTSLVARVSSDSVEPSSSSGGLSQISNRLPQWLGQPISRRTSAGGKRVRKGESRLADVEDEGVEVSPPTLVIRKPSSEIPRRRHKSAISHDWESRHSLGHSLWRRASPRSPSVSSFEGVAGEQSDTTSEPPSVTDFDKYIAAEVNRLGEGGPDSREKAMAKERNARIIQALAQLPENSTCADCRAEEPRWASWSLGVFLCIRCSGQHRSLGTHISKVKSIDLDDWSDSQIKSMQKWSNTKANEWWEANRPPDILPTDETIGAFIKQKYATQAWVPCPSGPTSTQPIIESGDQEPEL